MDAPVHAAEPVDRRRVKWWQSLRTRMLLRSTFASLMLLTAMAAAFFLGVRQLMIDNARAQMRDLAAQTTLGVAASMGSVQVAADTLAIGTLKSDSDPARWRAQMQALVQADPDVVGAMMVVDPGKLPAAPDGWTWYVRRDGDGLFETTLEDLGYEYRAMPWYYRTAVEDDAWWSEPYANAATDFRFFVTYNLPLRQLVADGGYAVIGMVSLDMPLARLLAQVGSQVEQDEVKPGLLSPERLFVAHLDPRAALNQSLDDVVARGRTDLQPFLAAVKEGREIAYEHVVASEAAGMAEAVAVGDVRYSIAQPVGQTGWTVVLSAADDYLLVGLNRISKWVALIGLIGGLLGMLSMRRTAAAVAGPIEDLTESARHFGDGEFDRPIGHVERDDEVGVMARVFDDTRHSVKRQMREIAELGEARARIEGELRVAGAIQQAMLPAAATFDAGGRRARVAGMLEPAKAVGGDFFNYFCRHGEALWFVLGDVSDKGIPAALFMARTMTVLEVAAEAGGQPADALRAAARHLQGSNEACMFATVLCGVLQLRSGEVVLASAAHEAPVWLHADGRREYLDVITTAPLGIDVADEYPQWRGRLLPGDTLLAYSDGVNEAFDPADRPFGHARLLEVLDASRDADAQARALLAAVHAFAAGAPQSDDITVLAIGYGTVAAAETPEPRP